MPCAIQSKARRHSVCAGMTAPDAAGEVGEQRKAHRQHRQQPDQHADIAGPQRPAEQVEAPCVDVQQQGLVSIPAQPWQGIEQDQQERAERARANARGVGFRFRYRAYSSQYSSQRQLVVIARQGPLQVPGDCAGKCGHRPEHEESCRIAQFTADRRAREADRLQPQRVDEGEEHHAARPAAMKLGQRMAPSAGSAAGGGWERVCSCCPGSE